MKVRFDNQNIHFSIGSLQLFVSNIVFECLEHPIPKHSHSKNSYEIHYIPYGCGSAAIDGQQYEITPNTLFVTGPYVAHEQKSKKEDPMYEYCIYLKCQQIPGSKSTLAEEAFHKAFTETSFWLGEDRQELHPLMKQLFFELEHPSMGFFVMAEALLKQILVKVVRNYEGIKEEGRRPGGLSLAAPDLIDSKYLIIEECFLFEYQSLTLKKLASRLGLGSRQTERLLKEQYGGTFLQKRSEARMSAASIMLGDSSKSITDIAEALGYSTVEHFSAAFKRYYGSSPTNYRRSLKLP